MDGRPIFGCSWRPGPGIGLLEQTLVPLVELGLVELGLFELQLVETGGCNSGRKGRNSEVLFNVSWRSVIGLDLFRYLFIDHTAWSPKGMAGIERKNNDSKKQNRYTQANRQTKQRKSHHWAAICPFPSALGRTN